MRGAVCLSRRGRGVLFRASARNAEDESEQKASGKRCGCGQNANADNAENVSGEPETERLEKDQQTTDCGEHLKAEKDVVVVDAIVRMILAVTAVRGRHGCFLRLMWGTL